MTKPTYAAYTQRELDRVNDLLFAARQEALKLGMNTIVLGLTELRQPLTDVLRKRQPSRKQV